MESVDEYCPKFMYCSYVKTYVIILKKGFRVKIHKWGNKRKVSVIVYKDGQRSKRYLISNENAEKLWKLVQQLYENYKYSKEEHFNQIPFEQKQQFMVNLYKQLIDDILSMVVEYAKNCN